MANKLSSNSIYIYISFIIISFIFLAVHSTATSPLYIADGGDSAIFQTMGQMLLADKIPYIDFFDHKGPIIIFIEAFGQWVIPSRTGIFALQIINLSLILFVIFKTSTLFLNKTNSFTICILTLLFFVFTIDGGNMTEEYSILFTLLALYITLKTLLSSNQTISPLHIFILGTCAAFLLWLRLNNLGVICACTIFLAIMQISNRDIKGLKNLISYFLLGILIITIPILTYFYKHNALHEMIYASFIYNLQYAQINKIPIPLGTASSIFLYLLKTWGPFIILFLGTSLYYLTKKRDNQVILLSILLFILGYVTTHIGAAYHHYMTLNIPCLVLGLIYLTVVCFDNKSKKITILLFISASVILSGYTSYCLIRNSRNNDRAQNYIDQAQEVAGQIPQNEKNFVYAYETQARFYISSGTLPCYKYFILQEWQGKYNPQLLADINDMLENNSPKWVITQFRDQSTNHRFWEIIDQKYELHYKNYLFELYKLKR